MGLAAAANSDAPQRAATILQTGTIGLTTQGDRIGGRTDSCNTSTRQRLGRLMYGLIRARFLMVNPRSRFMLQLTYRIHEVVKGFAAPTDRRCGAALHRCCCCSLISSAAALPPPPAAAAASSQPPPAACSTPAASPPHDASALTSRPLLTEAAACCSLACVAHIFDAKQRALKLVEPGEGLLLAAGGAHDAGRRRQLRWQPLLPTSSCALHAALSTV